VPLSNVIDRRGIDRHWTTNEPGKLSEAGGGKAWQHTLVC
jgi:hypothetical protein